MHPFACTTNLMDSLDPATLRRFLFKVEFQAMKAGQPRVRSAPTLVSRRRPSSRGWTL